MFGYRVTMMLWMITDVSEWMSIREITESWRPDTVRNIPMKCIIQVVENASMYSVVDAYMNSAVVQMVRQCKATLSVITPSLAKLCDFFCFFALYI